MPRNYMRMERDMRRQERDMNRIMRHRGSRSRYTYDKNYGYEDGRNPYGSSGGYVVPDRRDYKEPFMDYNYDEKSNIPYRNTQTRDFHYPTEYYGSYGDTPFYVRGMDYRHIGYDGGYDGTKLDKQELEDWADDLREEIEPQYKSLFTREKIQEIAKQMNIELDKFSIDDLIVATLMVATDYAKSIGQADINRLVAMGKEWLCDKDSNLKYGDKLAAYYDDVING